MPDQGNKSKAEPKDSRLDAFMREAMAILSSQRDMTPEAQVKLKALAKRLNLPEELYQKGLKLLANPQSQVPKTRWEKSFVKYLDKQFSLLPGSILTGPQEQKAKQYGQRKFGLSDQQCDHWIRRIASQKNVACISQSEALEFAEMEAKRLVDQKLVLDPSDVDKVYNATRRLGISQEQCEQLVKHIVQANRSQRKQALRIRQIKIFATALGVLLLGGVILGYIYYFPKSGPVGKSDGSNLGNTNNVGNHGGGGPKKVVLDWLPPDLRRKISSPLTRFTVGAGFGALDLKSYIHVDPVIRRQAIRSFFSSLEKASLRRDALDHNGSSSGKDIWQESLAEIFSIEPDEDVRAEILQQLENGTSKTVEHSDQTDLFALSAFQLQCESCLIRCVQNPGPKDKNSLEAFLQRFRPGLEDKDGDQLASQIYEHRQRFSESVFDNLLDRLNELQGPAKNFLASDLSDSFLFASSELNKFLKEPSASSGSGKGPAEASKFRLTCWLIRSTDSPSLQRELLMQIQKLSEGQLPEVLPLYLDGRLNQVESEIVSVLFEKYPNPQLQQINDKLANAIWFASSCQSRLTLDSLKPKVREKWLKERVMIFSQKFQSEKRIVDQDLVTVFRLVNLVLLTKGLMESEELFDRLYLRLFQKLPSNVTEPSNSPTRDDWQEQWKFLTDRVDWEKDTLESQQKRIVQVVEVFRKPDLFGSMPAEFFVKAASQSIGKPKEVLFAHLIPQVIQNPWIRLKIADHLLKAKKNRDRFAATYLTSLRPPGFSETVAASAQRWKLESSAQLRGILRESTNWDSLDIHLRGPLKDRLNIATTLSKSNDEPKAIKRSVANNSIQSEGALKLLEALCSFCEKSSPANLPNFQIVSEEESRFLLMLTWWWKKQSICNGRFMQIEYPSNSTNARKLIFQMELQVLRDWLREGGKR